MRAEDAYALSKRFSRKIKSMSAFSNTLEFNTRTIKYAMKAENWEVSDSFKGTVTDSADGIILTKTSSDPGIMLLATLDMPCNLQNKNVVITLRADANVSQLQFIWYCTSRTTSKFRQGITVGTGLEDVIARDTVLSLNPQFLNLDGGTYEDLKDFRRLGIRVYLAEGQASASVTIKEIKIADAIPAPGAVALVFDDGWLGQYDRGYQKMKQYNMPGSIGVITDFVGTPNYCTIEQLTEMYNAGWDMVSHTKTHAQLAGLSPAQLKEELIVSQQYLADNGFLRSHRHFIYPGLSYDDAAIEEVKKYYLSARSKYIVKTGYPFCERYHYGHAVYIRNNTPVSSVKAAVDRVKQFGGVCMITFHNIVDADPGTYDYLTENFNEVIDYIASSGVRTVTISDLFEDTIPDVFL